jgi:hypothetical protein
MPPDADWQRLVTKVEALENTVQGIQVSFATAAAHAEANAEASRERHKVLLDSLAEIEKREKEKAEVEKGAIRVPATYFWGFVAALIAAAGLTQAGAIIADRAVNPASAHAPSALTPTP